MSMYTQLLDAALDHRRVAQPTETTRVLAELRVRRSELLHDVREDADDVSVVLARQIAYDLALLRLAAVVGLPADPSRFEPPEMERHRLEEALGQHGIELEDPGPGDADPTAS